MKCPKCQTDNPEDKKFCRGCGEKLSKVCPHCGSESLPGDKFCGECGQDLSLPPEPAPKELSFDEKLAKIQRYLPKDLTSKILAQRDKIEGERKLVTVMFCDMEGFTRLSEGLGAEEAYEVMDQVYEILIHKVHDYGGTVNEMTGDGIMALFGAPITLEDAPQRAIRSAMAIHREMARFGDRIRQEKRGMPPLRMRIGIHTGPVVVGTLGNDLRVEFKAVGDTVNLASRIEGLAEPGTTYVSQETFRLTEGFFRFEILGKKQVKGKEQPVKTFRVIAPSTRRTRFDVSAERGLTPFVGRERELELLLDGFDRAKGGRGQAFSIVSEAGIGKSRLLYEFRKTVANENVTFLEGRCLSYSRGVAYYPVIDILKSNFDIQEGDGDSEIREKVKSGLGVLGVDEGSTLPYLLELLSVKDSGIDKISMSPEAKKDHIMETLKRIPLKGSEIRPLVMAVEDFHWIDRSSEESFKDLLDSIAGARVFLIFTYRPEFVPTWGGRSYHSQVNLNRLSNRESLMMASHLLGTEELDQDLEGLILDKTEGVPFFIEEFIRSLRDLHLIQRTDNKYHLTTHIQDVTIPSTIQAVIMARVDLLPEGAREVLQVGSVIEREFRHDLLKRVAGRPEEKLLSNLSVLKDSELLYERGIYPQSTYVFKNALTREVVYDSILTRRKKKLHEEIGTAFEELYGESIDEHYGVLAEHFIESENYEKGAEYSRLAERKAEKTASLGDATEYAKKRIVCLERLPKTNDVRKRIIDARTVVGLYYIQISYHIEAKQAIDPIIDLAIRHDYKRRLSQIYTILGVYDLMVEDDSPKALKHLGAALEISEEVNDVVSSFFANDFLGVALSFNTEFEKAFCHFEKALNINEAANNLWGISVVKSQIGYFVYGLWGRINLSYQTTDEAIQVAEESGDTYSKAFAYTTHGISCHAKGLLEEAVQHLLNGVLFFERISYFAWDALARFSLAETYFDIGDFQKSRDSYDRAIWLLERNRSLPSFLNLCRLGLARAKVMNNEKDVDLESLYAYVYANKIRLFDGWMPRYMGEILLEVDDQYISEAEEWLMKAIKADKRNDMMLNLGRDYVLCADLFKRKGDQSREKENLDDAIEIFKRCGADGWLKKAEKELAALSQ